MKFCDICNNMFYVSVETVEGKKKLVQYCKSCGHKSYTTSTKSMCIIDDNKVSDKIKYSQYVNKWIKYDPCLPRVKNITCPNETCTKDAQHDNEVIYIKYDNVDMKYLYHCCHCEHFWTNES